MKGEIKYFKAKEVSEELQISIPTLWRWVKIGKFPKPIKLAGTTSRWTKQQIKNHQKEFTMTQPMLLIENQVNTHKTTLKRLEKQKAELQERVFALDSEIKLCKVEIDMCVKALDCLKRDSKNSLP